MTITRWSPIHDLASVEVDRLNRMFNSVFGGEPLASGAWTPAVDIFEAPNHDLVVKAEVPAMKKEDIKVTVEQNVLTIEGERKFESDVNRDQYHRLERGFGSFRRSFTLPATLDASRVSASYQDGVLTVTLPQRAEAKPRQIEVNG
ncbi:MAG: Hsp20/alpha crystallin family protein [Acidobacteria bacterium]|jgi:HSP20 family protein|nr:Hsp20/alpha crystallin family protein [Acidobacteriota bacterium]